MLSGTAWGREWAPGEEGAGVCSASSSVSFELQQKEAYADTREEWDERDLSSRTEAIMDSAVDLDHIYSISLLSITGFFQKRF